MSDLIEWEMIGGCVYRTPVIGGWLVRYDNDINKETPIADDRGNVTDRVYNFETRSSLIFLPDEKHAWDKKMALTNLVKKSNN